jgi:hypothetical protein
MISNFNIETNLLVEFLLPDEDGNSFLLGLSLLGGDDVLGGYGEFIINESLIGGNDVLAPSSGLKWQEVGCETSQVGLSIGGSIADAIYFQPEPATADLILQSFDLDPTVNKNIRANTKIRVRLDSEEIDRVLFVGYIDTIDVTYFPQGPNLIRIRAFDLYKAIVNFRLDEWDTTVLPGGTYATVDEVFDLISTKTGTELSPNSLSVEGKIPSIDTTNILVPDVINDAISVGLAVVWIDQDTEQLTVIPRPQEEAGTATTYIIGNNHSLSEYHLCLSEIVVSSDADAVYNSLKVALTSDPETFVIIRDQDSIDLYGESAIDTAINTTDSTELDRWATAVYEQAPTKLVSQVSTPAKDRLGNLTEAAVFTPGTLVGVSYTKDQLNIVGYYTIIKVNHDIDVDNWFTTLELWKAA